MEYLREERLIVINEIVGSHDPYYYKTMLNIGQFNGIIISVQDKEKEIPHFHFYRGDEIPSTGRGGGCIMIREAKYYDYASHNDRLSVEEVEGMVNYLSSPRYIGHSDSVWKHIICGWNSGDPKDMLPLNLEIPDYTKLLIH